MINHTYYLGLPLDYCTLEECEADDVHYHEMLSNSLFDPRPLVCSCLPNRHWQSGGLESSCFLPRPKASPIDTTEAAVQVLTPSPWREG